MRLDHSGNQLEGLIRNRRKRAVFLLEVGFEGVDFQSVKSFFSQAVFLRGNWSDCGIVFIGQTVFLRGDWLRGVSLLVDYQIDWLVVFIVGYGDAAKLARPAQANRSSAKRR